jgi:hypothetical protein
LAIAINRSVRADDEWFDEPDDIERLRQALSAIDSTQDPAEANKRTALLLVRWTLDRNGLDGTAIIPPDDFPLAGLLVKAAAGTDVEAQLVAMFVERVERLAGDS